MPGCQLRWLQRQPGRTLLEGKQRHNRTGNQIDCFQSCFVKGHARAPPVPGLPKGFVEFPAMASVWKFNKNNTIDM